MMREVHVPDPRRAGQVRRYHTWPHHREQSNADHQWQVARVLLAIWPSAPRHLIVEALFHDVGELRSGDPPFPLKRDNPELKRALDTVEHDGRLEMTVPWALPPPVELGSLERYALKLADLIEMLEWALHEENMGNRYAALVAQRVRDNLSRMLQASEAPPDSENIRQRVENYVSRRERIELEIHQP